MKNKILRITKNNIPYAKELRSLTKSIASAILMQQLDFWFFTHPDKFYKFMTKPDAPTHDYKDGDSWEEEIGISPDEFRSAFDNIGIRYKSKTEYLAAKDKFDGRYYCSYFDRTSRKTWYFRNHDLLDEALDNLVTTKANKSLEVEKAVSRNGQSQSREVEKAVSRNGQSQSREVEKVISRNGQSQSREVEKAISRNGQSQSREVEKAISRNGQSQSREVEKAISILYTEITPEITPEITTKITTENIENIEKGDFSFFQNSPILKNQENAALPENSISEPKQEIEESCAAPPEIYAIAITEKKIKKARPKKPNEDLESKREAFAPFVVVFNQTAPDRWGKSEDLVEVLDKLAIGRLNTFTKKYGDRSLEIFQKGLLYTHTSKFHCETVVWTLGQYLSNEKPNEFAEKYDRIQAKNQTPFAEESPDRPMSEFDKKAMANYVRFKTAYEKRQQENAA